MQGAGSWNRQVFKSLAFGRRRAGIGRRNFGLELSSEQNRRSPTPDVEGLH
jgi:hypothetical protein